MQLVSRPLARRLALTGLAFTALSLPAVAQQAPASSAGACATMAPALIYGLVGGVLVASVALLVLVRHSLKDQGWSLANALSEVTELVVPPDPNWTDSSGDRSAEEAESSRSRSNLPAETLRIMEPSTSRLIALLGSIVLLLLYLGFGAVSLFTYGRTCQMPPSTGQVTTFLYAGLALFAPYVANKVSDVFAPLIKPPVSGGPVALPSPHRSVAMAAPEPMPAPVRAPEAQPPASPAVATPAHVATPAAVATPAPPSPHRPTPVTTASTAAAAAVPAAKPAVVPAAAHAAAPSQPAPAQPHERAVSLIAEFEGFRSAAYPDPASGGDPWTIGYGFTQLNGRAVRPGDTISREQGDQLLRSGVAACAAHLAGRIPSWAEMDDGQQCALISFAWNLGEDFYGDEADFGTISRDLREKLWERVPQDLCLYCDPGTPVEAGLLRRRQAEGALWSSGGNRPTTPAQAPAAASAPAQVSASAHPNPLPVPWFDQLLMNDGQGWRDCFSASSAMLAAYWGKEPGENQYNAVRERYGDSTSSEAQLAALRSLGLQAQFGTDGSFDLLRREIDAGRPVAVGWLHHGPPSAPSGGGHWTVVIGYDATGVIMNDPNGSCDLVNGGYPSNHNGAHQHYSFRNWGPRWLVGGSGGWYLTCRA